MQEWRLAFTSISSRMMNMIVFEMLTNEDLRAMTMMNFKEFLTTD